MMNKMRWPLVSMGEIAQFKNGLNYDGTALGRGLKLIGISDFGNSRVITYGHLKQVSGFHDIPDDYLLKENDLLFVRSNGNKALIGRAIIIKNIKEPITHSGFTIRARIISEQLRPDFVSYLFTSDFVMKQYHEAGSGTNISNLSQAILSGILIPKPPLQAQDYIIDVLGSWDRAISLTERLIAAKQERRKWLMQQLLTGKRRLPQFSKPWKLLKIGELLKEVKRPVKWDDGHLYKLISVRRRSEGLFRREDILGAQIKTKKMNVAKEGDFLISKMQIVHGASGLVTEEFDRLFVSDSYIALRARDPKLFDIHFFNWLSKLPLMYHHALFSSYGVHIEKMTFNLTDYLKRVVVIPPSIEEQQTIVRTLKTADRELDLLRAQLDALREQKKGLMQQLLTGKVRVKTPEEQR